MSVKPTVKVANDLHICFERTFLSQTVNGPNYTGMHELNVLIMCSALHCLLILSVLLFFLSHHVLCSTAYSERNPYTFCRTLMRE